MIQSRLYIFSDSAWGELNGKPFFPPYAWLEKIQVIIQNTCVRYPQMIAPTVSPTVSLVAYPLIYPCPSNFPPPSLLQNRDGSVESSARLTVHSRPNFVVTPRDQTVPLHRLAIFQCRVTGNPPPAVFWQREGRQVGCSIPHILCYMTSRPVQLRYMIRHHMTTRHMAPLLTTSPDTYLDGLCNTTHYALSNRIRYVDSGVTRSSYEYGQM